VHAKKTGWEKRMSSNVLESPFKIRRLVAIFVVSSRSISILLKDSLKTSGFDTLNGLAGLCLSQKMCQKISNEILKEINTKIFFHQRDIF
jgi:hypothetical protein